MSPPTRRSRKRCSRPGASTPGSRISTVSSSIVPITCRSRCTRSRSAHIAPTSRRLERYLDGLAPRALHRPTSRTRRSTRCSSSSTCCSFSTSSPSSIGRYARTHDALARKLYGEPWPRRAERRPGKLRIGYLSDDFRNHVMGKMMWEALRHHDRDALRDRRLRGRRMRATTGRRASQSMLSSFQPLGALSDRRRGAAHRRRRSRRARRSVDAHEGRAARHPRVEARARADHARRERRHARDVGDRLQADRSLRRHRRTIPRSQIEPLLAMDGCVYPYRHIAPAATAAFSRRSAWHRARRDRDRRVLHAAQAVAALPRVVARRAGARSARACSHSRRSIRRFGRSSRRIAAAAGIDSRRIVFLPQGRDDAENQARYRLVDFVLDPMPYGGVNGTLEALDMGVPVVTLVGKRHAERTSYSILANLGVTRHDRADRRRLRRHRGAPRDRRARSCRRCASGSRRASRIRR